MNPRSPLAPPRTPQPQQPQQATVTKPQGKRIKWGFSWSGGSSEGPSAMRGMPGPEGRYYPTLRDSWKPLKNPNSQQRGNP
jgi:hypothetical protein